MNRPLLLPLSAALLLPVFMLAGCKTTPRVVVDPKGVDQVAYEKDLAECTTLADEARKGSSSAGRGALGGAVIGGAIGGIFGGSRGAATMGGGGAVIGGSSGANQDTTEKDRILKNCMTGRGYRVLN